MADSRCAYPAADGLSVFFRDITEHKRSDEELRAALDAAQAAIRARSQFLAMMSHELRTPMQAVLGYADLLLAGADGSLSSEQTADIQTIRLGAERMIVLVNQMLDLSGLGVCVSFLLSWLVHSAGATGPAPYQRFIESPSA